MSARRATDLSGQTINSLVVLRRAENTKQGSARWHCRCVCGAETIVRANRLMNSTTISCGCITSSAINLLGQTFGDLTVISRAENYKGKETRWNCLCRCGNTSTPHGKSLRGGGTKTCGCGVIAASTTQGGFSKTPGYKSWEGMVSRTTDPSNVNFFNYGGRGINIHPEWQHNYSAFIAHIGPKPTPAHSVERIDNDRGYIPGNVKWATMTEQANNRRNTLNVVWEGLKQPMTPLEQRYDLPRGVVHKRLLRGWGIEKALLTPARPLKYKQKTPTDVSVTTT